MLNPIQVGANSHHGPVTSRCADALALRYGFENTERMAENIPEDSRVLDVGAGLSNLGNEIASTRPDINWCNLDINYNNAVYGPSMKWRFERLVNDAPNNVEYVTGSILSPSESLVQMRFARIFSYYVLPHVALYSPGLALIAMHNMRTMSSPGGIISIGPIPGVGDPAVEFIVPDYEEAIDLSPITKADWYNQEKDKYFSGMTQETALELIESHGGKVRLDTPK
ncbi:MAG TPA: hypothetical protein PKB09_02425 [Candidatus Saccharibacteria bacterium]|nr:hypothetical protein [Candidatus Saccharibacteria bacterium]